MIYIKSLKTLKNKKDCVLLKSNRFFFLIFLLVLNRCLQEKNELDFFNKLVKEKESKEMIFFFLRKKVKK